MLAAEAPPLLDYLNHLARIQILALGGRDPVMARMYVAHWAIIPNLGLDLMVTPLLRIMPPLIAGRIAAGVAIVLPVVGAIAYSRASFRTRSYWPLGACLVAYNATVLLGFLNFVAATGFAMLLAAVWVRWRDRSPALVLPACAIGAVGLFFCHLMGVVLFLILVAAFELECVWRHPRAAIGRFSTAAMLPIGPTVLYALSPLQAVDAPTLWLPAGDKALQLLSPFLGYAMFPDLLAAAFVASCVVGLALGGGLRMRAHGAIALAVLSGCYTASPFISKGTCFLDTRFAIMIGYLLFAAIIPARVPLRVGRLIAVCAVCLFAWRITTIGLIWHAYQQDLDGIRAAITSVEPGDTVYTTSVAPEEAPAYWAGAPRSRMLWTGIRLDYHLAGLLVLERRAFWPFLFSDPAQQPLAVLAPYRRLAEQAAPMLPHLNLRTADDPRLCDYDYVLLLDAGGEPDVRAYGAGRLALVRANEVAALYRIGAPVPTDQCGPRHAISSALR
jgi:hypothetical protein